MAPDRPGWVIKDLSAILGLDADTIAQLVLPDLETYPNETRLAVHLQDFLGPTPQARAFIDKYTAHRFPRLPSQQALAPPSGPAKPLFSQPSAFTASSSSKAPRSAAASGRGTPKSPLSTTGAGTGPSIQEALESAFGPGGKVYQKNREVDGFSSAPTHPSSGPASGATATTSRPASGVGIQFGGLNDASGSSSVTASGAQTPSHQNQASMRRAGAVTITEARPRPSTSERASQKGKQRQEEKIWDHPKSKAVLRLESLLGDLRKVQEGGKIPRPKEALEGDCFCQEYPALVQVLSDHSSHIARLHTLSSHTPICSSCGLTICALHPPTSPCPSCYNPLLSPAALSRLIMRVEDDIAAQLGREQDARDTVARRKQLAAQAEAAFPSLSGPAGSSAGTGGTSMSHLLGRKEEGRKVLTIGAAGKGKGTGKGKGRVILTTTTLAPASSPAEEMEEEEVPTAYAKDTVPRPRSPPMERVRLEKELAKHLKWREEEDRPFGDMKAAKKGDVWSYVDLPIAILPEEGGSGRRKNKGGGGQGVGGRAVPGAKAVPA